MTDFLGNGERERTEYVFLAIIIEAVSMRTKLLRHFLIACLVLVVVAVASATLQRAGPEPKASAGWFQRSRDQMNLRMPGSAPFHMKVTFHAFPGDEVLGPKEKPQILTGDGVYEETWLAPHHWRREVKFAGYHAVEVESDKGRKMQASSDYEPGRVLMLLNALLDPIPRNLASLEFAKDRDNLWKIDHVAEGNVSLVRLSRGHTAGSADFNFAYYFLPRGLLLARNNAGLVTDWNDGALFAGKLYFRQITIRAGERNLLTAEVDIASPGQADLAFFDLPVPVADPGMTLRPLQGFEVRGPQTDADLTWMGATHSALSVTGVVDRTGKYRDVELVLGVNAGDEKDLRLLMDDMRKSKWHPAQIDKSPCESRMHYFFVKTARLNMIGR